MTSPLDLIVKFTYNSNDFEMLDNFEERLERAVTFHSLGTYDGYDLDSEVGSNGEFYMSTTDGDLLFKTIRPLFADANFLKVTQIVLQDITEDGNDYVVKEYEF